MSQNWYPAREHDKNNDMENDYDGSRGSGVEPSCLADPGESVPGTARPLPDESFYPQRIIDAIPAPVFFKDAALLYVGCNRAFARMILGDTPESIAGKSVYDVSPPELAAKYKEADQALFADGGTQRYETQVRYQDGTLRDVEFHKAVIYDNAGGKLGLVGTILDITERRRREAEAERLANFDTLTGLPNRRQFQERGEAILRRTVKADGQLGMFYLDLDRFKDVNDTRGHEVGDKLLVQAAARLHHALRDRDILARLGGDEFAVVIPDTNRDELTNIARRLLVHFEPPFYVDGHSIRLGVSIGVVTCPDDGTTLGELLKHADIAMYRAKNERTGFKLFEASHVDEVRERVSLEQNLMRAMDARNISLVFQPRTHVRKGWTRSVEALARWHHPERGNVPASQFIPLAEAAGLIRRLDRRMLTLACGQIAAWRNAGLDIRVAINVSARELHDPGFAANFMDTLAEHDVPGEAMEVEITETALMTSSKNSILALRQLKAMGVAITVDDFGTGYSSLALLKQLPVDTLKIDRAFVANIDTDPTDAGVVEAIVALTRSLGLGVVAEGVESKGQEQALLRLGCELQQGYRFCKPLAATEIEDWLQQRDACP